MKEPTMNWFAVPKILYAGMALGIALAIAPCQAQQRVAASSSVQQPPPQPKMPPKPVPLEHLYWHFLVYQQVLDTKAAELQAQGKDGSWLRDDLQTKMGFSDADYTSIRASSIRLSSEIKTLDAQAATIRAGGPSAANASQLEALLAQREAYIAAEVNLLRISLPPDRITTLESFITQFFAPKHLAVQTPPSSGQAASAGAKP